MTSLTLTAGVVLALAGATPISATPSSAQKDVSTTSDATAPAFAKASAERGTTSRQPVATGSLPGATGPRGETRPGADTEAGRRTPDAQRGTRTIGADEVCPPRSDRSLCFMRIEAEYNVLRSGDVVVTERYTIRFNGSWNGATRQLREEATAHDFEGVGETIPDARRAMRHVDIEVIGATDGAGNELRVEEERSGWEIDLRIWIPDANDAVRTMILSYRIRDAVTFFSTHDELYWDAMGSELAAPLAAMDVRVVLPEGASGLRAAAFAGAAGSREQNATARVDGLMLVYSTTQPLYPGNGLTIVAGWDPGVVERPGATERALGWLGRYWSFALPFLSLALMWRTWSRRGRDPTMLPVVTRYEPPDGLPPGVIGTMLDERADMRDVTATLVDLAVHGHLRIEEVDGTKLFGLEFGEDFRFVQTTPPADARPLEPHERRLLSALFDGRTQVELSDLKNEFYKDLPEIREAMMDSLVSRGVYERRPDKVRGEWIAGAFIAGVVLYFLLGFLRMTDVAARFAVPFFVGLPMIVFGWLMPARTVKGTRLIERLRGFREFLERVDGDRLRRMPQDPTRFERLLPYAMAFGVEKKWAEAFEGLDQQPPQWYHARHGGAFRPTVFASTLSRMSTQTASAMTSSPKSSSGGGGSGFGGGGSVGGGGGGGGAGGF